MLVENDSIWINCEENGKGLSIGDFRNRQTWNLAEDSMVFSCGEASDEVKYTYAPLRPVSARQLSGSEIAIAYEGLWRDESYRLEMRYRLGEDYAEVTLAGVPREVQAVSLPGSFRPASRDAKYLIPIMQGMYWDGRGDDFEWSLSEAHHGGFSMAMFGMLGQTGGLLVTAESNSDVFWRVGKRDGQPFAANMQRASLGCISEERSVRLYLTAPTVTAVAKRYRKRVTERGRFISWEEKLKTRPELERLFGTVFGFLGYCQDSIDYAAESEKLKGLGFPRAHLFPVKFNTYSEDFEMGGFPPIKLEKDTIAKIKSLGYDVAPWSWIGEGLDDGSEEMRRRYRIYRDGKTQVSWEIDDFKWYKICNYCLPEYQEKALSGVCADMTWDHFDVITCACNHECYALNHPPHLGRPMGRAEDREWLRKLMKTAQAGGSRPISSESFNDAFSLEYDIGSVLAWPQYGPWEFWPVPLTMLVYHDSMIHTWWEVHGYNDTHFGRDMGKYQYGGGRAALMSAMDALYGNPPFIFPFGAQYAWTGNGKETALYQYRLEDPAVQVTVGLAAKVAGLHKKIGKLEMTGFEFITPDGYVQKTTFENGMEVYANFGPCLRHIPEVGTLESASWKVTGA